MAMGGSNALVHGHDREFVAQIGLHYPIGGYVELIEQLVDMFPTRAVLDDDVAFAACEVVTENVLCDAPFPPVTRKS